MRKGSRKEPTKQTRSANQRLTPSHLDDTFGHRWLARSRTTSDRKLLPSARLGPKRKLSKIVRFFLAQCRPLFFACHTLVSSLLRFVCCLSAVDLATIARTSASFHLTATPSASMSLSTSPENDSIVSPSEWSGFSSESASVSSHHSSLS